MKEYYVYIMASKSGVLYIGVTNNLEWRVYEHQHNLISGFTAKYKTHKLVFFESCNQVVDAITREKQLKNWRREKKFKLIKEINPNMLDLSRSLG